MFLSSPSSVLSVFRFTVFIDPHPAATARAVLPLLGREGASNPGQPGPGQEQWIRFSFHLRHRSNMATHLGDNPEIP